MTGSSRATFQQVIFLCKEFTNIYSGQLSGTPPFYQLWKWIPVSAGDQGPCAFLWSWRVIHRVAVSAVHTTGLALPAGCQHCKAALVYLKVSLYKLTFQVSVLFAARNQTTRVQCDQHSTTLPWGLHTVSARQMQIYVHDDDRPFPPWACGSQSST